MADRTEFSATPEYSRGERVTYKDHQNRIQSGDVLSVEAHWPAWSRAGDIPYLLYTISHPTYKNRWAHVGTDSLVRSAS